MPTEEPLGFYTGRVATEWLCDGRRMKLIEAFCFTDADGMPWPVPPETIVDGASIPRPLWSLIGGPFEGKYRASSVIHDYYCDVRTADWKAVHLVFYRGMLVSGVSWFTAKIMYTAVYYAGPRWNETVTHNANLRRPGGPHGDTVYRTAIDPIVLAVTEILECEGRSVMRWSFDNPSETSSPEVVLRVDKLKALVEKVDPPLSKLTRAIDEALKFLPGYETAARSISVGELTALE